MTKVDRGATPSADRALELRRPDVIETNTRSVATLSLCLERSRAVVGRCVLSTILIAGALAPALGTAQEAHEGKSADEIAKELANPNTSLASLKFRNQYRSYTGDLPGANDQDAYTLVFQPVFPFPLAPTASGGKSNFYLRPAIPLLVDQPVPTLKGSTIDYEKSTAIGDISFDAAFGVTTKTGLLWALGLVGTLPTATDKDVAGKQWRAGPEVLIAKQEKWGLYGIFPNHQWDVVGWGNSSSYSTTTIQPILLFTPGGGWKIGTEPIITYDWINEQWTAPLQLLVGKTIKIGNTPIGIDFEVNYYVDQADAFGPKWMFALNITPVVPNFINTWIRGK
jgi:hypothetical protein